MRRVTYTDLDGRIWPTLLPPGLPDSDASMGLPLGPPSLGELGLPLETEIRLHNQLVARGILTLKDAKTKRAELTSALLVTFAMDGERIISLFAKAEQTTIQPEPVVTSNGTTKRKGATKTRRVKSHG